MGLLAATSHGIHCNGAQQGTTLHTTKATWLEYDPILGFTEAGLQMLWERAVALHLAQRHDLAGLQEHTVDSQDSAESDNRRAAKLAAPPRAKDGTL